MKYGAIATTLALFGAASVEGVKVSRHQDMPEKPKLAQVKTQARAARDLKIQQKVKAYKAKHGARLAQKHATKSKKPVTGHKKSEFFQKRDIFNMAQTKVRSDGETLKDAADGLGVYMGAAMKWKNFLNDDDGQYGEVAAREYDLITPENFCKPKMMLKSSDDTLENSYVYYDGCHYLNDYAIEHDMAFRGHALVWPAPGKYPDWFEELEGDDRLEDWMIDYIIEVMHEMGDMYAWDVVNEAISNSDAEYIKGSVFNGVDDFICTAFSTAKAVANENGWETLMFYNEYDFESMYGDFQIKSDKVYTLMQDLVENDCGVDGVGFQTHIDIGYSDENIDGIQDNFDRLADLGLYVQYTEIDVRCGKGPNNSKYTECPIEEGEEWTSDMLSTQSAIYRKLLNSCIYSANCLSFETWGYTDKYCFLSDPQQGMPFDDEYNAKAAVKQMLNKLNNTPRTANAVEARLAGELTS